MKKTILISMLFFFLGTALELKACSPTLTPFQEWLSTYNKANYIIIEGYFQLEEGRNFTSKIKITRSSDSSIKTGQVYEVYEYGPFGSMCEMYEMKANIERELTGKNKPRFLIAYKQRSTKGKLVTPIFWEAGVDASNNKIVTKEYDYKSKQHIFYECTSFLSKIWRQISETSSLNLQWEIMKDNNKQ